MKKKRIKEILATLKETLPSVLYGSLKKSPSFKRLLNISMDYTSYNSPFFQNIDLLVDPAEIEDDVFWENSKHNPFLSTHQTSPRHSSSSASSSTPISDPSHFCYQCYESFIFNNHRSSAHLWIFVFLKLLDRSILSAVAFCHSLKKKKNQIYTYSTHMALFHQSVLWNLRLVWFASCFSSRAACFGKQAIWTYIYGAQTQDQVMMLDPSYPLSHLRFFKNDAVFVSKYPEQQLGGGFLGILALGDNYVDPRAAARAYEQEILAQQDITRIILQLKVDAAHKRMEDPDWDPFSFVFLPALLEHPLTHFMPLLASCVDYHGFRIMVYPLYNRTPLVLKNFESNPTIFRQLQNVLETCYTLKPIELHNINVLRLEIEPSDLLMFHKVYQQLVTSRIDEGNIQHHYRPLVVRMCAHHLETTNNRRGDEEEENNSNASFTKTSYATLDHPYGFVAFPPQRFNIFNPVKTPQQPLNFSLNLHHTTSCRRLYPPNEEAVLNYLETIVIPRALSFLEEQPLYSPYDALTLRAWLHSYGVNHRYLGVFLMQTRHRWLQRLLVIDIVSRILKNFIRDVVTVVVMSFKKFSSDIRLVLTPGVQLVLSQPQKSFIMSALQYKYSLSCDTLDEMVDALFQRSVKTNSPLTLWTLAGYNIVKMAQGSNHLASFLWKSIIAKSAQRAYHCREGFICPKNCPMPSLVQSFLHHSGHLHPHVLHSLDRLHETPCSPIQFKHLSVDRNTPTKGRFSKKKHFNQERFETQFCCDTLIQCKPSMQLSVIQNVLPIFSFIRQNVSDIPVHNIDEIQQLNGKELLRKTLGQSHQDANSSKAHLANAQTKDSSHTSRGSPLQDFVSLNILLLFDAMDHVTFHHQHSLCKECLSNTESFFVAPSKSYSSETPYRLLAKLFPVSSGLFQGKIKPTKHSFPTRIECKNANYSLFWTLLDLASWAMAYACWDLAKCLSQDAIALFKDSPLVTIHGRWIICWATAFKEIDYQDSLPNIPIDAQRTIYEQFCVSFDLLDQYWNRLHPLTGDTLVSYAWIYYVMRNYLQSASLVNSAINQISLTVQRDQQPIKTHCLEFVPFQSTLTGSFCLPSPKPLNKTCVPYTRSKLGHLHRLVGLLYLKHTEEYIQQESKRFSLKKELSYYVDYSVECFRLALSYVTTAYTNPTTYYLVAPCFADLASALLLQYDLHNSSPEESKDALVDILSYFLTALSLRYKVLPITHFQVMLNALGLGLSLELTDHMALALEVFEQLFSDQIKETTAIHQRTLGERKKPSRHLFHDANTFLYEYSPCNLFSLLIWSLPYIHFNGIHEIDYTAWKLVPSPLTLQRLCVLSQHLLTRRLLHISLRIKERLTALYINYSMSDTLRLEIFSLFHRFYQLQHIVEGEPDPSAYLEEEEEEENYQPLHFMKHMLRKPPMTTTPSQRLCWRHDLLILWIRNYPRLMSRHKLISIFPLEALCHAQHPCHHLFQQLVQQCTADLIMLEKRIQHASSPVRRPYKHQLHDSEVHSIHSSSPRSSLSLSTSQYSLEYSQAQQFNGSAHRMFQKNVQHSTCLKFREARRSTSSDDVLSSQGSKDPTNVKNHSLLTLHKGSETPNNFLTQSSSHISTTSDDVQKPFLLYIKHPRTPPALDQHSAASLHISPKKRKQKIRHLEAFFKHFLDQCHSQSTYPLYTPALDLLSSALYWYLNITLWQAPQRSSPQYTSTALTSNHASRGKISSSSPPTVRISSHHGSNFISKEPVVYDFILQQLKYLLRFPNASPAFAP